MSFRWIGLLAALIASVLFAFLMPMSVAQAGEERPRDPSDEMFFYRDDGLYRYYNVRPDGNVGKPIVAGDDYDPGWTSVTAIDLDGDGTDEMFFYRDDGLFRFHEMHADGTLGEIIKSGDFYTAGWSSITSIDLDGDGADEMFFYRPDGLFRYYDIRPDASLGQPIQAGDHYTKGWSSITAIDLDGDVGDEIFFYREDGLFRYYDIRSDGSIPSPSHAGDNYTRNWTSISAVDLDGDRADEMFFYREDGLFRYYNVRNDGSIPKPLSAGDNYTKGWSAITAVNLDHERNPIEVTPALLARAFHPDGGNLKCKYVDLSMMKAPPNPGLVGENVNGISVPAQIMWELHYYLMLYTNCERQKRGLDALWMYSGEQMIAMQQTMIGNPPGHHNFGQRSDIAGGGTAEQAFGTRRVLMANTREGYLDDDGDGIWDPHETARRVVSGANYFAGLVTHGGATFDPKRTCVFGGATLGPEAKAWMPIILFYGSRC